VVEPIKMAGRNWSVMLSSQLSAVDTVVSGIFRKALYASAFVVLAMTAILSSTSIQMIRGRLRLERIRNELLARELTQARKIQLAWLPNADSTVSGVDVAAINEPASHVSGDFYDWFELPDGRTVVTIGDVTGHGMSAAFLMATTQLLIRNTMARLGDPGACLEEVNRQLCSQIFNGQFVTALIVVLDSENGNMSVGTAGHFPPLLSDGERLQTVEMEAQLVLGVEKNERYQTERFDLPERFVLLLYTDGVIDAQGPGGERFRRQGVERALGEEFESAQEVVDAVVHAIRKFRGGHGLGDDLTLVAIQSEAAAVSSGVAA
jgi:sigma-B regulation protein RsbU (phosphoserine phosphatase)